LIDFEFGRTGNTKKSVDYSLEFKQSSGIIVRQKAGCLTYSIESKPALDDIYIPISIFSNLSCLQAIVKYLQDVLRLNFSEIARLLNRDQRTIWATYDSVRTVVLQVKDSLQIPLAVFADRNLSTLESLVFYLKNQNLKFVEIAKLLNKNQRTIWTVHNRALNKLK
jgi:DNA-directed RNA polymerase specialized sigma24 family protein